MAGTDDAAADAQRHIWALGDYPAVAQRLMPAAVDLVDAAGVGAGARVLDVGVGDGNAAVAAARRGAAVTGVDISPAQLALARRRMASEGLDVELHEGDAQDLPVPDAAFDAVVSAMGVIFAPDHRRAMAEMARTCRAGGRVGIVSWADAGWFRAWRARAAELVPPAPPGSAGPEDWGDPDEVRRRFEGAGLVDVAVEERPFDWRFGGVEDAVDFFLRRSGPFIAFREAATAAGHGDEVRPRLLDALTEANAAADGTCRLPAPYLRVLGRRP